jgi:hypothetical protein
MRLKKIKKKLCKQCGKEFTPYNTIQPVCSVSCAVEFNKPEQVEKRYNEIKNDARPLSWYEKKAKAVIQLFARIRDSKEPCISCDRTESPQFDGGHYKKAELYSGVIFNELNVNKQCCYCNRDLHGNESSYREGLVRKYGEDKVKELEDLANKTRQHKYTKFELLQIEKHYKEKIKNLIKQNL